MATGQAKDQFPCQLTDNYGFHQLQEGRNVCANLVTHAQQIRHSAVNDL